MDSHDLHDPDELSIECLVPARTVRAVDTDAYELRIATFAAGRIGSRHPNASVVAQMYDDAAQRA
jgi:hypothetical protein